MAVFRQPIDEGCGQMVVFQKRRPLGEAKVGGDQRGFFLVSSAHEGKKQPDLYRLDLHIAQLINQQAVGGGKCLIESPGVGPRQPIDITKKLVNF
jgi:hypothetical protein